MGRIPNGIVERTDDGYVGYCHELGTTAQGSTVEEAFANLHTANQEVLQEQDANGELVPHDSMDAIAFFPADENDGQSAALAAMTAIILEGLGDYERLDGEPPTS